VAIKGGNAFCRQLVLKEYEQALAKARREHEAEKKEGRRTLA
jgi:hypothetical protein